MSQSNTRWRPFHVEVSLTIGFWNDKRSIGPSAGQAQSTSTVAIAHLPSFLKPVKGSYWSSFLPLKRMVGKRHVYVLTCRGDKGRCLGTDVEE